MSYTQKYRKRNPWAKHLKNIYVRIKHSPNYKNIKNYLNTPQIKFLWFRDEAYLLVRPSIHRRNNKGNYTVKNCRFIELKENVTKTFGRWAIYYDECKQCHSKKFLHNAKGLCRSCYGVMRRVKQ